METKIDSAINEYLSILVNEDKIDDIAIQNLLDKVRNFYDLDVVYIIERCSNKLEFYYSYISCSKPEYNCLGKVLHLTDAEYAKALSMYNNQKICIVTPENNTEKFTCDYCINYGFVEGNFYQGSVGFQSNNKRVWSLEEQEALKKLSRVVRAFITNKEAEYRANNINEQFILALKDIYYTSFLADWLQNVIPTSGTYSTSVFKLVNELVCYDYRKTLLKLLDKDYISKNLNTDNRSFFGDYCVIRNGVRKWCRLTVILVDVDKYCCVNHILVTLQDITEQKQFVETSKEAFELMQDSYYRISVIDLDSNRIINLKTFSNEENEEKFYGNDFAKSINFCAEHHLEGENREKFLNIFNIDNLKSVFSESKDAIEFTYKRKVNGVERWVKSEIVPINKYKNENICLVWYVKNITKKKAKEKEISDRILQKNARLRSSLQVEEQYKQAILSESIFAYRFSVSKNKMQTKPILNINGKKYSIFNYFGFKEEYSYEAYNKNFLERVKPESRSAFEAVDTCEKLIDSFNKGKKEISIEYKIVNKLNTEMILRQTILLTKVDYTGEILGFCVSKDITSQRLMEYKSKDALQVAYEAATKANNAKTEFLSHMSHDIRTPINAIICMAAIADANLDDKEKVANCLGKINVASSHLLSLVNEVLDMSKIESGKLSLSEEEFNLSELIDNLLDIVKPSINEKNHELIVNIKDIEHEDVIGDTLRIQQAFVNIINNAVKYTQNNGRICINISEKPTKQSSIGCYEFIFEDNGFGMSEEFLKVLFKPFERAKDDRVNKIQGTGLGMAITENIVHMMNGDIKVESKLGEGTKFTVTIFLKLQDTQSKTIEEFVGLPVLVVDDEKIICESTCNMLNELKMNSEWVLSGREAIEKVYNAGKRNEQYFAVIIDWKMPDMDGVATTKAIRKVVGNEVPIIIFSAYDWSDIEFEARAAGVDVFISKPLFKSRLTNVFKNLVSEHHNGSHNQLNELSKRNYSDKRVLLVEDNDLNREIAVEILKMAGLKVEEAKNGKEAVDMVTNSEIDYYNLIFMDIQMPIMNGYQATAAIRALNRRDLKNIPIIAMTANAFTKDIQAAKNCGMNEHIAKPIDFKKLIKTLDYWL